MDSTARIVFADTLRTGASAIGVPLTTTQIEQCALYTELLLATNEHTNLTRITDPPAVAIKHFVDSFTLLKAAPHLPPGAVLLDVGTGAGFPGLAVKIIRPDLTVLLLDSGLKRLAFLRGVIDALRLDGVDLLHARAEEAGRNPIHRDRYDLVCARAVASLPTLLEWCGPLVRTDGRFVALKSAGIDAELAQAQTAADLLKLRLESDTILTLPPVPGEGEAPAARRLLVYRKRSATPARFPRRTAESKTKPLGLPGA